MATAISGRGEQLDAWEADADLMAAMGLEDPAVARAEGAGTGGRAAEVQEGVEEGVDGQVEALDEDVPSAGGLPSRLRGPIAESFGAGLDDVQIREGNEASAIGADAYASGNEITFAPGQYDPDSANGRQLIGHELAHVAQQREGRVAGPQGHDADHGVVDDPALEAEADTAGAHFAAASTGPSTAASMDNARAPIGGRGATGPIQRRVTVTAIQATFEPDAAVVAKTVDQFLSYTRGQADWSTQYAGADKPQLQQLLHDLLAEPALPAGLGSFTISAVLGVASGDWVHLRRYCAAVSDAAAVPTAKMSAAPNLVRAIQIGTDLPRLEAAVGGGGVLYHITAPDSVGRLLDANRANELIAYCAARNPQWQAPDGKEFDSFLLMPAGFHAALGALTDVRNLHHFDFPALIRLLVDRFAGAGRPLSVILHSGLDHSGAFHHDAHLTSAITGNRNRVVMIEGRETLESITNDLPGIAAQFGGGQIDQVMIAGHGNTRAIDLAGTTTMETDDQGNPEVGQSDSTIDLDGNPGAGPDGSDRFMDTLLGLMGGPTNRIVFNGCLTASNDVTVAQGGGDPQAQIAAQLAANASLVEYMRHRPGVGGTQVIGGNASFPEGPDLLDAAGNFDISWIDDPALTSENRLDYVRLGIEPTGVLRAVLENWAPVAVPPPPWLDAVTDRLTRPTNSWDGALITTALTTISADPGNAVVISDLAHSVDIVSEGFFTNEAQASRFALVNAAQQVSLFGAVEGSSEWPGDANVPPIGIYSVWARRDATKYAALLTHLTARAFTTSQVAPYLDWTFLTPADISTLLPSSAIAAPTRGHLVVACSNLASPRRSDHAREFLRSIARANSNRFPTGLNIGAIADDSSEEAVLTAIGLAGGGGGGGGGGDEIHEGNVDRDGDGTNESWVDRTARFGTVANCSVLTVRAGPGMSHRDIGFLHAGDQVFVQGMRNGWAAIEFSGQTGYCYQTFVTMS